MGSRPGPGAHRFVQTARYPVGWLARALVDNEVRGREYVPDEGPYIVAANHLSLIDPVFVTLAVGRLVRFLALDELYGVTATLDRMISYFGSIPISRERPPLGALQQALNLLWSDEVIGVFPEGARAAYWRERSIKNGAAWLSLATGAVLLPCAITGTEATMSLDYPGIRVPSIRLSIHPPLDPATYLDRVDPIGAMMDDWGAILDQELNHWQPAGRAS